MHLLNHNISAADSSTGTDSNNHPNTSDKTFNTLLTAAQPYESIDMTQQVNNQNLNSNSVPQNCTSSQLNSMLPQNFASTQGIQQEGKKYIIINQQATGRPQATIKSMQPIVLQNMNFNQANQMPQFIAQNNIGGSNLQMGAKKIILIPSNNMNQANFLTQNKQMPNIQGQQSVINSQ